MSDEGSDLSQIEAIIAVGGPPDQRAVAFISYTSLDDAVPDEMPAGSGFVRCLQRQLFYELETERGLGNVLLWRDRTEIEPGDVWSDRIVRALEESEILLVILSRMYRTRPWCNTELETFSEQIKARLATERHGRIIRVDKQQLEEAEIPPLLRRIQAIRFFSFDRLEKTEQPFFWRGRVRDERFYEAIRALALSVERIVKRVPPGPPPSARNEQTCSSTQVAAAQRVFVAKPAQDLRREYRWLVDDLHARGFRVFPDPAQELPDDYKEAILAIRDAISDAVLAIHLVGDRPGFTPFGGDCGVVPLQMSITEQQPGIERLIWAPRVLPIVGTEESREIADKRGPLERLARLGVNLLQKDQVDGGPISEFYELVLSRLSSKIRSPEITPVPTERGHRIYLLHQDCDRDFAVHIAKLLRARGVTCLLPPIDGEPLARAELHERRLAEAETVFLCWRDASRTWVEATALALAERIRRRQAKNFRRVVVLGGHMTESKAEYLDLYPPDEIDMILNGTGDELHQVLIDAFAIQVGT